MKKKYFFHAIISKLKLYRTILDEWEKMEGTYNKTGVDTLAQIKSEDIPLAQVGFQMFIGNF